MESWDYMGEIIPELKAQTDQIRAAYSHELSSHAFASLYLWRNHMGLTLYLDKLFFTVKCDVCGTNAWFFPCGEEKKKALFIERHMEETDFSLCYLRERDRTFLETHFPGKFLIREEECCAEYLYDRREYETISGGRFSNMRKQIRRLTKEHTVSVQKLGEENERLALETLDGNLNGSKALDVAKDALFHRKELEMSGVLIFVDGTAQSLVMGFPLTKDTVDGCIDCSNTSIHGLSYFGKRVFFLSCGEQYRFLNAEEDLGLPGLRMMKRHMAPIRTNKIWSAKYKRG